MTDKFLSKNAYIMQEVYKETRTHDEAIKLAVSRIKWKMPPSKMETFFLSAMWHAIDAYVDINES